MPNAPRKIISLDGDLVEKIDIMARALGQDWEGFLTVLVNDHFDRLCTLVTPPAGCGGMAENNYRFPANKPFPEEWL